MKIAISAASNNLDGEVADVFGRCPFFIFAEIEDGQIVKTEIVENAAQDQPGGAGLAAARLVAEKGAEAVICSNIGPRAADVLVQFKIKTVPGSGPIRESLRKLIIEKYGPAKA